MKKSYGLQPHYLLARNGSEIRGVLPLLHVKSILFGNYLTSMPGGLCAADDHTAAVLAEQAQQLVVAKKARYLILRDSYHKWDIPGWVTNEDHCTLMVKLSEDSEQVWRKVKRRARQLTNKAIRAEVKVTVGANGLDTFYPAYLQAMRDKGTPTLGQSFFRNVATQYPAQFDLLTVRHEQQVLGGGSIAPFKDTIYCTWGGMLRQFYNLYPNHLLYWETLKYGCENGFQWVDLGRSAWKSGTFTFKKNWGAEPRPLYQQYYLNGIAEPPAVGSSRESDAKYRLFVKVWNRAPLSITEIVGPRLRRWMPFG